jgi:tetraacyldisaccharide 4'-kinase
MKLIKPKFWETKNFISLLFYPLSTITHLVNLLKKLSLKKKFGIKTICVGNIFIGGTGKTSLTIEIQKLLNKKFKTVFIKKNYQNHLDEIKLLKKKGKVISANKRENALLLAKKKRFELAILDDGLQQKNINYDLKIVCFNTDEGLGNEFVLPAGPLREDINEIKKYDILFLNGEKKNNKLLSKLKSINKNLKVFKGKYKPSNLKNFNRNKKYLMFCGIGNPNEFERTLVKYKFKIKHKIIYPDHYEISINEINQLKEKAKNEGLIVITTEKDFLRLSNKERKNIKFLKVGLKIKNIINFKKALINKL